MINYKKRPRLNRFKRGFLWDDVAEMVDFVTIFGQKHAPKSLRQGCLFYPRLAPGLLRGQAYGVRRGFFIETSVVVCKCLQMFDNSVTHL